MTKERKKMPLDTDGPDLDGSLVLDKNPKEPQDVATPKPKSSPGHKTLEQTKKERHISESPAKRGAAQED